MGSFSLWRSHPSSLRRGLEIGHFFGFVSNGVRIGVSNFCTSLREWSCTRNVTLNSPPRLGGEFLLQAPHKWPISSPLLGEEGWLRHQNAAKPPCEGAD